MKQRRNNKKRLIYLLILNLYIFSSCDSFHHIAYNQKKHELKMMKACKNYIENYSPLYIIHGDTVLVARFNTIPDSINNYLINCASINNFKPLKYSAALIIRHNKEYIQLNNQDYMLMDGIIHERNGFIVLIRQAMSIGRVNDDFLDVNYFPFFSGDVCEWIEDKIGRASCRERG